jgi:hypothetical protein
MKLMTCARARGAFRKRQTMGLARHHRRRWIKRLDHPRGITRIESVIGGAIRDAIGFGERGLPNEGHVGRSGDSLDCRERNPRADGFVLSGWKDDFAAELLNAGQQRVADPRRDIDKRKAGIIRADIARLQLDTGSHLLATRFFDGLQQHRRQFPLFRRAALFLCDEGRDLRQPFGRDVRPAFRLRDPGRRSGFRRRLLESQKLFEAITV